MTDTGALVGFLARRSPEQLAEILRRRPDATWGAPVAGLSDLAERLSIPSAVRLALVDLPAPAVQVLHALLALGPSTTRPALNRMLAGSQDPSVVDAAVDDVLRRLEDRAIAWTAEGRIRHDPALRPLIPEPINIAPTVTTLLERVSRHDLAGIAKAWGLPGTGRADEVIARLTAVLTDPDRVRALLAEAPGPVRTYLTELAASLAEHREPPTRTRGHLEGENWARQRGLLFGGTYDLPLLPVEVVLAIREDTGIVFMPRPPADPTHPVGPAAIRQGSAAAAADAGQSAAALIDRLGRVPVAALKAGGIGARELGKLGKVLGQDEDRVRLDLELLRDIGLLAGTDGGPVGTGPAARDWRGKEPAARYADLVAAWWGLPIHPTIGRDAEGKALPAAGRRTVPFSAEHLRAEILLLIETLGPDQAFADDGALAARLVWERPLAAPDRGEVTALWREAHVLGVLVDGALSPVGSCLLDGEADALLAVAAELLPAATSAGRFGSDLTVMVAGSPSAAVSALLDTCAEREGRGAAVVWRFSPASVRRAFDEGWTAEELTAALRGLLERAAGTDRPPDLPQPLTYLIADVARRHGHLVVLPAASCVRSADPALLAEVVAHRSLHALRPHLVTAEVAVFQAGPTAVVGALRGAGYLPVPADEHGVVDLRRAGEPAGPTGPGALPGNGPLDRLAPARPDPERAAGPDAELLDLAGALLRTAGAAPDDGTRTETEEYLELFAPQLGQLGQRQLAYAIDHQVPARITYRTATGGVSRRTISEIEMVGDHLYAWCHLRDDQREFSVDRILDVQPAPG